MQARRVCLFLIIAVNSNNIESKKCKNILKNDVRNYTIVTVCNGKDVFILVHEVNNARSLMTGQGLYRYFAYGMVLGNARRRVL